MVNDTRGGTTSAKFCASKDLQEKRYTGRNHELLSEVHFIEWAISEAVSSKDERREQDACKRVPHKAFRTKEEHMVPTMTIKKKRVSFQRRKAQRIRGYPDSSDDILSSLAPLSHETDQRADTASQTDNTIVDLDEAQSGKGEEEVAKIRDELCLSSTSLTVEGQQSCVANESLEWAR